MSLLSDDHVLTRPVSAQRNLIRAATGDLRNDTSVTRRVAILNRTGAVEQHIPITTCTGITVTCPAVGIRWIRRRKPVTTDEKELAMRRSPSLDVGAGPTRVARKAPRVRRRRLVKAAAAAGAVFASAYVRPSVRPLQAPVAHAFSF